MKVLLANAAVAVAVFPAAAAAQNPANWSGAHVGIVAGWDQMTREGVTALGPTYSNDGIVYGGDLGFDHDSGGLVLGVEAEITGSTVKECASSTTNTLCIKRGRDLYAGGRLGVAIGSNRSTLVYMKGGYSNAAFNAESTTGTTLSKYSFNEDGFRIGAGLEHRFSDRLSAKVEYRYSRYGSNNHQNQILSGIEFRF